MRLLLLALTATLAQALTVVSLTHTETYGLCLEKDSIVSDEAIAMLETTNGKRLSAHVAKVYVCDDKECIEDVVNKYKSRYKTNGICYISW
jgi:hypothetical protein